MTFNNFIIVRVSDSSRVNLTEYYDKYWTRKGMLRNSPPIINIDGLYYDIQSIIENERNYRKKNLLTVYYNCIRRGEQDLRKVPKIIWRRTK